MDDYALLNYVREGKKSGKSDEAIKHELAERGYDSSVVDRAFHVIERPIEFELVEGPLDKTPETVLIKREEAKELKERNFLDFKTLFVESLDIYARKWHIFFILSLIPVLYKVFAAPQILPVQSARALKEYLFSGPASNWLSALLALAGLALFNSLFYVCAINALEKDIGFKEAFFSGLKAWPKFFILYCILAIGIFAGLALFLIPGIFFMIWMVGAPFIFVRQGGIFNSMKKSREFLKGRISDAAAPIIILPAGFYLLYLFLSESFRTLVAGLFYDPFSVIFNYMIFKDLELMDARNIRSKKEEISFARIAILFVLVALGVMLIGFIASFFQ